MKECLNIKMNTGWYPENKDELNKMLEEFLSQKIDFKAVNKEIHGIIVPHAGYAYSGRIAGKAFSLLKKVKDKNNCIVILFGPSHYEGFYGISCIKNLKTPLGNAEIIEAKFVEDKFPKINREHSIENQIPFLQKLGFKKFLPMVVGNLFNDDAEKIAKDFLRYLEKENAVFIFSTDLSHFQIYEHAVKKDKKTIEIIKNLNFDEFEKIDACGKYPLLILMNLCEIKNWRPKLIEYKNSGDIMGDKSNGVVGYGAFWF